MKFDLSQLMKQAKKIQAEMKQSTEELKKVRITGESGGGMVKALFNGNYEIIDLEIEKSLLMSSEKEMLENLVVAAINSGLHAVRKKAEDELGDKAKNMMSNLDIDEFDNLGRNNVS